MVTLTEEKKYEQKESIILFRAFLNLDLISVTAFWFSLVNWKGKDERPRRNEKRKRYFLDGMKLLVRLKILATADWYLNWSFWKGTLFNLGRLSLLITWVWKRKKKKRRKTERASPPARIYTCTIWFGRTHPPSGCLCETLITNPLHKTHTHTQKGGKRE